jgi:hypothetical protein
VQCFGPRTMPWLKPAEDGAVAMGHPTTSARRSDPSSEVALLIDKPRFVFQTQHEPRFMFQTWPYKVLCGGAHFLFFRGNP